MATTTFGEQLEKLMRAKNLSAAELSHRIYGDHGRNRTQIERWLKIGREKPSE